MTSFQAKKKRGQTRGSVGGKERVKERGMTVQRERERERCDNRKGYKRESEREREESRAVITTIRRRRLE